MRILVVILVGCVAAGWANKEEEQDETEIIELEDPSHWRLRVCGTRQECRTENRCIGIFILIDVCRTYCDIKKCSGQYNHHPHSDDVHCNPVRVSLNFLT